MPKPLKVSHCDIEVDLSHIERSLLKIDNPQIRYWLSQFVDLVAEGVISVDERATIVSEEHTARRKAKLREGLKREKAATGTVPPGT